MSQTLKSWKILACMTGIIAIFLFLSTINRAKDIAWQFLKSDLFEDNEHLRKEIANLKKQNMSLKKYIDAYEINFIALKDISGNCYPSESALPFDFTQGLAEESFEIRQIYLEMLGEKKRWDQYQQEQYENVLESTVEPHIISFQGLIFENEDNRENFLELESALKLHKRLIRDVRLFHDEIQYQKKQVDLQPPYQLYDLKFKLAPFARESALVDALQQAMSALSAGIYQRQAVEVLDRIGDAFTKPIQELYEQQQNAPQSPVTAKYNYDLYTVYGKN